MIKNFLYFYRHRALAEILVARELKARYRGTMLGFLWSFANPLLMMSIYVLVFRYYVRIEVPNYPAFVMCALLPWMSLSAGITEGMGSILGNGGLIKKVHLPVEVFPFVAVASNLVHFILSLPVLILIMLFSHVIPSWHIVLLPVLLALQFLFTYALALFLASLTVQFRDLTHVVPNLLLVWFYLSPIFYAPDLVPERFRPFVNANPLAWLIQAYRDIFLHQKLPSVPALASFLAVSLAALTAAMWLFWRRRDMYPELV